MKELHLLCFVFRAFLYLIFNNEFSNKEKILKFFIFIIILISLFKFISPLRQHFIDRTFEQVGITQTEKNPHYNFFDSQWGAHFLTSFEIFKNYKITGSGLKTFRIECASENYSILILLRLIKDAALTHIIFILRF